MRISSTLVGSLAPQRGQAATRSASFLLHLRAAVLLLLLWGGIAAPSLASTIWVGSGAGCDTTTLALALLQAGFTGGGESDEIRLTENLTSISQDLTNWNPATVGSISIVGGYAQCGGAQGSGRTMVSGSSSGPVFEVVASVGNASHVILSQLSIRGATAHRGLTVSGSGADVFVLDTEITANVGGVEVNGGEVSFDHDTQIRANNSGSSPGGGILCSGAIISSRAVISANENTSSGGGVQVGANCEFDMRDGSSVEFNQARWGGGIAVSSAGSLLKRSTGLLQQRGAERGITNLEGVRILSNTALDDGGGVYAVNGAIAYLDEVHVRGNMANRRGGGIYADDALVTMDRIEQDCFAAPRCSWLKDNQVLTKAGGGSEGIGVYATRGAFVGLFQTFIEGNRNFDDLGQVLYASGLDTQLVLESVSYSGNSTIDLVVAVDAEVTAAYISAANNTFGSGASEEPSFIATSVEATLSIFSSAFEGQQGFLSITPTVLSLDCVVAPDLGGATTVTRSTASSDPLFVSPLNDDLTPLLASGLIDRCDYSMYTPTQLDALNRSRGVDYGDIPNTFGVADVGAYERENPLFADGFELGNTSAWSSTVP